MRKRIPVKNLAIGMFIDGMDAEWFNTPFILNKFPLKDRSQIEKLIKTGITHVFIDTQKGRDVIDASAAGASVKSNVIAENPPTVARRL